MTSETDGRRWRKQGMKRRHRERNRQDTDFFRLLSDTMHSTSSSRQFVQGAPCSVTLQRTLRALQHWQALDALLLTDLPVPWPSMPAADAFRLAAGCVSGLSDSEAEHSDMATFFSAEALWRVKGEREGSGNRAQGGMSRAAKLARKKGDRDDYIKPQRQAGPAPGTKVDGRRLPGAINPPSPLAPPRESGLVMVPPSGALCLKHRPTFFVGLAGPRSAPPPGAGGLPGLSGRHARMLMASLLAAGVPPRGVKREAARDGKVASGYFGSAARIRNAPHAI